MVATHHKRGCPKIEIARYLALRYCPEIELVILRQPGQAKAVFDPAEIRWVPQDGLTILLHEIGHHKTERKAVVVRFECLSH